MERLVKNISDLRTKLEAYDNEIKNLKINSTFFGISFNHVTLTYELLNYYLNKWNQSHTSLHPHEIKQIKEENGERVMTITKWMFIALISAMEYDAKQRILESKRNEFNGLRKRLQQDEKVYLADIMEKSRDCRLLTHDKFNEFDAILYIRHCLIHNNGISGKDNLYAPIKKQLTAFKKDCMIQGNLFVFYNFTNILTDYYKDWLKSLHAPTP